MIEIKGLKKSCRGVTPLGSIDLKLKNGGVCGILELDGESGSLLLSLMAGVLLPDEGYVRINGFDTVADRANASRSVGYFSSKLRPYDEMTPEEYLTFIADAKGLDFELSARLVQEMLDEVELRGRKRSLCMHLGKAEQRRLCLAQALLGSPEFLIADHPDEGLHDRDARELLDSLWTVGREHTVFVTLRSMAVARDLCDRVLLMEGGRVPEIYAIDDPALEEAYRALCERHGVHEDDVDGSFIKRRQMRARRRRGVDAEESRG